MTSLEIDEEYRQEIEQFIKSLGPDIRYKVQEQRKAFSSISKVSQRYMRLVWTKPILTIRRACELWIRNDSETTKNNHLRRKCKMYPSLKEISEYMPPPASGYNPRVKILTNEDFEKIKINIKFAYDEL